MHDRNKHGPAERAADEHAQADAHAGDRAGGDEDGVPIEHHRSAHPRFAEDGSVGFFEKRADLKRLEPGADEAQAIGKKLAYGGQPAGNRQAFGGAHAFLAVRVQRAQRFGRRDAAGEAELLDVDHLPLHGDGHRDAEHGQEKHPGQRQAQRQRVAGDEDEGGEGGDQGVPVE